MKNLATVFFVALVFVSCKKERTCNCTLSYLNGSSSTEVIPIGKQTFKTGQDKCNSISYTYTSTPNLSSVKCEVK